MEPVVSHALPHPPAGDSPVPPKIPKSSPHQPKIHTPTTDPVTPSDDLQSGGSFSDSPGQAVEIQKEEARGCQAAPEKTTQIQTGVFKEALHVDAEDVEEMLLEGLAREIYGLIQNRAEEETTAQQQPFKKGSGQAGTSVEPEVRADNIHGSPKRPAASEEGSQRQAFKKKSGQASRAEEPEIRGCNSHGASTKTVVSKAIAQSGNTHEVQPDLETPTGNEKRNQHSNNKPRPQTRLSREEKGKWSTEHSWHQGEKGSGHQAAWQPKPQVKSPSGQQQSRVQRDNTNPVTDSWHQGEKGSWTEVKGPYWWRRERQDSSSSAGRRQWAVSNSGTEKFKRLAYGKCFNCFAFDHHVKDCQASTVCWNCNRSGHRSHACPRQGHRRPASASAKTLKQQATREGSFQPSTTEPPPKSHLSHSPTAQEPLSGGRSYLEVARGDQREMAMAAYPGDPRARPAAESVFISATGEIRRRRDALLGKAAVCKVEGNSHDTRPGQVGEALRARLGMGWCDFHILKHYPEQYLVIFKDERLCQQVTGLQRIADEGLVFHFAPWTEGREAASGHLEFRVYVRLEGIPPHAWGEEVAAQILGRSCAIHYVEEHTRRRERTRTYDLWAWCSDPCKIPRKVWLTVTDPDAEQPAVTIPRNLVQLRHDAPTGLKRGLGYEIFPHVAVVDDLSFINGDGGHGGPPNRKRRREFEWRYGHPDSHGEIRGNRGNDRGREEHRRHRRDDGDDDRGDYHRRRRSSSVWGRTVRCRYGVDDCISSNIAGYRGRAGGSYRSRPMQWAPKREVAASPASATSSRSSKRVSFANPIATILGNKNLELVAADMSDVLQAMVDAGNRALKEKMQKGMIMSTKHLENPLHKPAMEAIQEMLDHGAKLERKTGRAKAAASRMEKA